MENLPELISPGTHRWLRSQKSTLLSKWLHIKTYLCQYTSTAEMVEDGYKVISESFFATISDKGMQTPEPQVDFTHECNCMKFHFASICLFYHIILRILKIKGFFPHIFRLSWVCMQSWFQSECASIGGNFAKLLIRISTSIISSTKDLFNLPARCSISHRRKNITLVSSFMQLS